MATVERVLGDGASTCKDKKCPTCSELRETAKSTTSKKESK